MDDFPGLPLHVQNALRRAGVASLEQARALGRDAIARIPGVGPLALSRIFPAAAPREPRPAFTDDDLRRARRWFDALQDAAPARLNEADRVLADKIARLVG
jgi:hypothetical protein